MFPKNINNGNNHKETKQIQKNSMIKKYSTKSKHLTHPLGTAFPSAAIVNTKHGSANPWQNVPVAYTVNTDWISLRMIQLMPEIQQAFNIYAKSNQKYWWHLHSMVFSLSNIYRTGLQMKDYHVFFATTPTHFFKLAYLPGDFCEKLFSILLIGLELITKPQTFSLNCVMYLGYHHKTCWGIYNNYFYP